MNEEKKTIEFYNSREGVLSGMTITPLITEGELLVCSINNIIEEAMLHGSDGHGYYYANEKGLTKSIESLIVLLGVSETHEVALVRGKYEDLPQIVLKK